MAAATAGAMPVAVAAATAATAGVRPVAAAAATVVANRTRKTTTARERTGRRIEEFPSLLFRSVMNDRLTSLLVLGSFSPPAALL